MSEKKLHPNQIKGVDVKVTEKDGNPTLHLNNESFDSTMLVGYEMKRPPGQPQSVLTVVFLVKSVNKDDNLIAPVRVVVPQG